MEGSLVTRLGRAESHHISRVKPRRNIYYSQMLILFLSLGLAPCAPTFTCVRRPLWGAITGTRKMLLSSLWLLEKQHQHHIALVVGTGHHCHVIAAVGITRRGRGRGHVVVVASSPKGRWWQWWQWQRHHHRFGNTDCTTMPSSMSLMCRRGGGGDTASSSSFQWHR